MNFEGRLLVTGGAIGDIPTIQTGSKMGFDIYTSGNRPQDHGHKLANQYAGADYTDAAAIAQLVQELKIDFIIPSSHDTAYIAAARAAKICGLPGYDDPRIAEMIHQKDKLALGISKAGLVGIETKIVNDYQSALEFFGSKQGTLVIKPSDMTGGRGVSIVKDEKFLKSAINLAKDSSLSRKVLAQEYVAGSEHGFTAIIREQKVIFSFFDDEYRYLNKYRVAGTLSPSSIDNYSKNFLKDWVNSFSKHYKLVDGLIHIQFIQAPSGPKILEVCRRPPGDFYPYFVETATGVPYTEYFILGFTGTSIPEATRNESTAWITLRHVVLADKNGFYKGLSISDTISSDIVLASKFKDEGEEITDYLNETLAIIILKIPSNQRNFVMLNIQRLIFPIVESC